MKAILLYLFVLSALTFSIAQDTSSVSASSSSTGTALPVVCASCVQGHDCDNHPCSGRAGLTCKFNSCSGTGVTDADEQIELPLCQPTFYNKDDKIDSECLALSSTTDPGSIGSDGNSTDGASPGSPGTGSGSVPGSTGNSTDPVEVTPPTIGEIVCPAIYAPVCGSDNQTYGNACTANANNITEYKNGACPGTGAGAGTGGSSCLQVYTPVCGSDNKTYSNACFASAAGVKKYAQGACGESDQVAPPEVIGVPGEGIVCPMVYSPVCGSDNNTYSNECMARANNITRFRKGACEVDEGIPLVLPTSANETVADTAAFPLAVKGCSNITKPVCGSNNKTYANACSAGRNNITSFSQGACVTVARNATTTPGLNSNTTSNTTSNSTNTTNTPSVVCTVEDAPVCGVNNKTYTDNCKAQSANVTQYAAGECGSIWALLRNTNCTTVVPVCSSGNATYLNRCHAAVMNVTTYTLGACNSSVITNRSGNITSGSFPSAQASSWAWMATAASLLLIILPNII